MSKWLVNKNDNVSNYWIKVLNGSSIFINLTTIYKSKNIIGYSKKKKKKNAILKLYFFSSFWIKEKKKKILLGKSNKYKTFKIDRENVSNHNRIFHYKMLYLLKQLFRI